jgi:hypothetical protein
METLAEYINRVRKELAQARATRDRIEKTGESSSFGGISFSQVAYTSILRRISQLERDLFNAEAKRDGLDVTANERLARISNL